MAVILNKAACIDMMRRRFVWLVGCLTSQQQASVSQGRICSDKFTCCHTETEVADQTFYLTQSQYTDTGPTSPSADPITPGAWQGSHWSANFLSHWYDSTPKKSRHKRNSNPRSSALEADALPLGQRGGGSEEQSGWPGDEGVRLQRGRPWVPFPLSPRIFVQVQSYP